MSYFKSKFWRETFWREEVAGFLLRLQAILIQLHIWKDWDNIQKKKQDTQNKLLRRRKDLIFRVSKLQYLNIHYFNNSKIKEGLFWGKFFQLPARVKVLAIVMIRTGRKDLKLSLCTDSMIVYYVESNRLWRQMIESVSELPKVTGLYSKYTF